VCGIWGAWQRNGAGVDPDLAVRSVLRMKRRGPDDAGVALIHSASGQRCDLAIPGTDARIRLPRRAPDRSPVFDLALGQVRLSILDLSPAGHQPMSSAGGDCVITFNGEVFNYRELRTQLEKRGYRFTSQTDTEVVMAAYREWGLDCLSRFNGMWAFGLWDQEQQQLFLARDRFGVKPLVYAQTADLLAFASDSSALMEDPRWSRDLDPAAVSHYLSLSVVPAPLSIYAALRRLPPGHLLVADRSRVRTARWYDVCSVAVQPMGLSAAADRLDELLSDAVALRMRADVPVGAFLSGGVDSSVVSAMAGTRTGAGKLSTFSVGFPGSGELDETPHALAVAAHIGSQHRVFALQDDFLPLLDEFAAVSDEPFAVPSALGVYLLAREASREAKVVVTGDGGDEVFAGYWSRHRGIDLRWDGFRRRPLGWVRSATAVDGWSPVAWEVEGLLQRLGRRLAFERRPDQAIRDLHYLRSVTYGATHEEKLWLLTPGWAEACRLSRTEEWLSGRLPLPSPDRVSRWQKFDMVTSLNDEMLAKVDRATMAWGLEARTPLLDYRVVELGLSLPEDAKADDEGSGKLALKKVAERYVPGSVLHRRKQGFTVPLERWFGRDPAALVSDGLSDATLRRHGIVEPARLKRLHELYREAPDGRVAALLYSVLFLHLWLERRAYAGRG